VITGTSCSQVDLGAGKGACLSISLTEVDGGAPSDLGGEECLSPADCSTLHGTPVCAGGKCGWSCSPGFAHCASGNTGCETDITTVDNCGGCGNACGAANATANHCTAGQCAYDCQLGFLDCIKIGANGDGCESDAHSLTSCGACGVSCDTAHSVGTGCSGTACTYTGCMPGFGDCQMTGANADGCEFADVTHQVGVMSLTYSLACTPAGTPGNAGTYSLAMATAACTAWTTSVGGGTCGAVTCTGNTECLNANFGGTCVTWCYTKSTSGHVSSAGACMCPNTASPTWN